jgi:hypothetical protein
MTTTTTMVHPLRVQQVLMHAEEDLCYRCWFNKSVEKSLWFHVWLSIYVSSYSSFLAVFQTRFLLAKCGHLCIAEFNFM